MFRSKDPINPTIIGIDFRFWRLILANVRFDAAIMGLVNRSCRSVEVIPFRRSLERCVPAICLVAPRRPKQSVSVTGAGLSPTQP